MADVDPFIIPIPRQFLADEETREFFEYFVRWAHDMWVRTGGGTDSIEAATIEEKYPWPLAPPAEDRFSVPSYSFNVSPAVDRFNPVSTTENYTAVDYDFINAKSTSEITLPEYPRDGGVVIVRNGDGTKITIKGNGRSINGETTGIIYRKGTALTLQYFIDDNEWFAR